MEECEVKEEEVEQHKKWSRQHSTKGKRDKKKAEKCK